jgi:rhodanese-related sulfurtransferase
MRIIPPTELNNLLESQPSVALLDVRTPVEFAEIHVPQARNVPLNVIAPKALFRTGMLSKDEPVYLLCRSGTRAEMAAMKFSQAGFDNAVVVEGGTLAWKAAGLPLERGKVRVISLERQVRIAAGLLVLTGLLLAYFLNRWFIGLSAFVGAGLVFAGITDFCGMALLLAKLPWNKVSAA